MQAQDDRTVVLRRRFLERESAVWINVSVARAKALRDSAHLSSWPERQGLCTREILSSASFEVDDLDLLLGRLSPPFAWGSEEERAEAMAFLEAYPAPGGQNGHCELDLSLVMEVGINGVFQNLDSKISCSSDACSIETWRSFRYALEGLSNMIKNAAECARKAMSGSSAARKLELSVMAETAERISGAPPKSFREAVQLLWFVNMAVQLGEKVYLVGPGRMDRTLRSFYDADITEGVLTRDDALLLLESLYLLINYFTPAGLAVPLMVGGTDAGGRDMTHELSYLCLEALRRVKLAYPTVGVCWHEGTPKALMKLAVELVAGGYSTPAFFGDETIKKGLQSFGVPSGQACNYINSACVEITPVGASNVWVASPYFNTCGVLLDEIAVAAHEQPDSFEDFQAACFERLSSVVCSGVERENRLRREREKYGGKPLQSLFTRDCLDRGRDIDSGGALYNWVECSFVGLANLADSFQIVKEEIFNKKRITFAGLKKMLDDDFLGYEAERSRFLNEHPKYGQDNASVDSFVSETVGFVTDLCRGFRMYPDDSHFVPGAFVWEMHERFGSETGATPDGRKAGTPFADGAGPAQGRELKGPTAAVLSVTSWDHSPLIGGVAFNMKFNPAFFKTKAGTQGVENLVLTFLRRGGFETQINVVSREILQAAKSNPDAYRDLVVRIGGYTDYFTRLTPGMQEELIQRIEYHA